MGCSARYERKQWKDDDKRKLINQSLLVDESLAERTPKMAGRMLGG